MKTYFNAEQPNDALRVVNIFPYMVGGGCLFLRFKKLGLILLIPLFGCCEDGWLGC
jgi:hypothetical protein